MSEPQQQHSGTRILRTSSDSLSETFREKLSMEFDKPDGVAGGSKARHSNVTGTGTSSSSSSSESMGGKQGGLVKPWRRSDGHSGEILSATSFSQEKVEVKSRPGHRRSMSAGVPLLYSGRGFGNLTGGGSMGGAGGGSHGGLSGSSPNNAPKPMVLGSGTANYGHGSIMRSGVRKMSSGGVGGSVGNVDRNLSGGSGSGGGEMRLVAESVMKKAMASCDPEDMKKGGNEMYRRGSFVEALELYERAIAMSPGVAAYRSNRAAALTALGRLGEAVKECEEAVRLDSGYWRAHQRLASLYLR